MLIIKKTIVHLLKLFACIYNFREVGDGGKEAHFPHFQKWGFDNIFFAGQF